MKQRETFERQFDSIWKGRIRQKWDWFPTPQSWSLWKWNPSVPKLRRLSGTEVISVLERFGFSVLAQTGSHVKLRRVGPLGDKQTLTVPRHRELDTGTLRAILRQASQYIPEQELGPHFYTD